MKKIKLSSREVLVITIMSVFIMYAAYELFIASPSKASKYLILEQDVEAEVLDNLMKDVTSILKKDEFSQSDIYIVSIAETAWAHDPFYQGDISASNEKELGLTYTGYLELGEKRLAVINGMDYEAGDKLELGRYIVKNIHPAIVIVEDEMSRTEITIPFLDE